MRNIFQFSVSVLILLAVIGCARNAITGRSQLKLLPEDQLQNMAVQEYRQFLSQSRVVAPRVSKDAEMVARVGNRIANAITQFYTEKGLGKELAGYQWEYNLVENQQVNAWCMPGGKIVVYTGLLPVTRNEAALAVVMGHEIAHALAKHGNERMSQGLLQQFGGIALSVALSSKPAETRNLFLNAYGIGSQVGVMLPHSRKQELEADRFGLMYAALAGYNIREAIPLWERMAAMNGGGQTNDFFSTHPAEATRIAELNKIMEETLEKYYRPMN